MNLSLLHSEVEQVDLVSLVTHRKSVPARFTVGELYTKFQSQPENYLAILDGQRLVGVCSRESIKTLLEDCRYGFALYGSKPVTEYLGTNALVVARGTPLLKVLEQAVSRTEATFFDDIALVDDDESFLGMISARTLVRLQSILLAEKIRQLETTSPSGFEISLKRVN